MSNIKAKDLDRIVLALNEAAGTDPDPWSDETGLPNVGTYCWSLAHPRHGVELYRMLGGDASPALVFPSGDCDEVVTKADLYERVKRLIREIRGCGDRAAQEGV